MSDKDDTTLDAVIEGIELYNKQLDEYMKEEYKKTNPKPNGMFGHWGWYAGKKRLFDEKIKNDRT